MYNLVVYIKENKNQRTDKGISLKSEFKTRKELRAFLKNWIFRNLSIEDIIYIKIAKGNEYGKMYIFNKEKTELKNSL